MSTTEHPGRRWPLIAAASTLVVVVAGGAVVFAARDDGAAAPAPTTAPVTLPATPDPEFEPVTTAPPATAAPATTAPPTTAPPTTDAPAPEPSTTLPQPLPPPPDPRAFEEQQLLGGISIPTLGVDAPLLEGVRLTTLDNGPGHWPGSAMPGEIGNVVVAAHRTSHGGPFRYIDTLVEGDEVIFTTEAGPITYTVTGVQIVEPDALWIVEPTETPTATLFACHPPGSVKQRIVVNLQMAVG